MRSDIVPARVSPPSLIVTTPRPAYRAPRPVVDRSLRPRSIPGGVASLGGDAGYGESANDDYAAATSSSLTPGAPAPAPAAPACPCGCNS